MRNVLAQVPRGNAEMVAAAVRTVCAQPDADHVAEQFETIAAMLGRQLPKVEQMMRDAREDLLTFTGFPQPHWRKIWSTNPLERVNREIKRRTEVVGVFPTRLLCSGSPAQCWSRSTTNGPSLVNAATSPKPA